MINDRAAHLAVFLPNLGLGGPEGRSGAERAMANLARGFAERGLSVDLVLGKAKGPYLQDVPPEVRIVDLKARRVLTSLPGLTRYLRRERPSALVSAMDHANVVALWAGGLAGASSTCIAVSVQNCLSLTTNRWIRSAARVSYPWASHIIAVSGGVADDLSLTIGLRRDRISVIYNPMAMREVEDQARAPVDHPWFQPGAAPVVLGVGRLTAQKDLPTLVRAFARLGRPETRLVILGEGSDRPSLERLIRDLGLEGRVALPGFVANPFAYMARASVFALSSAWEGLPTVLIEAMACGCPVVSTDCAGGGPREILCDGKYGPLVPVGDSDAMAARLRAAIDNPPSAGMLKARAADFSVELITDRYLALLSDRPLTATP